MNADSITIILPVYGRPELLGDAIQSVFSLDSADWKLLIADDGSDEITKEVIREELNRRSDTRIKWVERARNLGLFANLNEAIGEAETEWLLLLCSDDELQPWALSRINKIKACMPKSRIILSSFTSINIDGSELASDSSWHHDKIRKDTDEVLPERMVPALLELGAVNGNLTGMVFSRELWEETGPFRSDWRHAADWEWLVRAASVEAVVLNREPIARVRTHDDQLSNKNRKTGHETTEVAEVVKLLMAHPLLAEEKRRTLWAAHIMQFQLWNILKQVNRTPVVQTMEALRAVHQSTGLRQTGRALVRWLPTRWRKHLRKGER